MKMHQFIKLSCRTLSYERAENVFVKKPSELTRAHTKSAGNSASNKFNANSIILNAPHVYYGGFFHFFPGTMPLAAPLRAVEFWIFPGHWELHMMT